VRIEAEVFEAFPRIYMPSRTFSFVLANTLAVLAALYIAFAANLERPYWAMFSVFIVANPIVGAVRSKAAYRLLGTLMGASVALLLIPPLVGAPVLMSVATSLWVGICVYLSLRDRTPRSYVFLLAGYTATIVGLAVVDLPTSIFDTAVSRIEEISVGVICGAVAHSVILPQNVTLLINHKINATMRSAATWLSEAVLRAPLPSDEKAQEQLARVVTDFHILYTHVDFEISDVPRLAGTMRLLQDRLAVLLPRVSSLQKAIATLEASGPLPAPLGVTLQAAAEWFRSGGASELPHCLEAFPAENATNQNDWRELLVDSALTNLRGLVLAFADSKKIAQVLAGDLVTLPAHLIDEAAHDGRRPLHRDRGIALLSALAAVGATLLACFLWIEGSWPEGAVAAQFAAIGCSLAATLDHPAKLIRAAIIGILIALPFAAVYEFAILPRVDGFLSLAVVLTPAILLFSVMQANPRLEGAGLVLAIAFSGGLALQGTYKADFAVFVNSSSAEIVGLLVALGMNRVFRTIDPAWNALRIASAGRKAVARLAVEKRVDPRSWAAEMFDRLGLVTSRTNVVGRPPNSEIDVLRDMRVGLNVATLRRLVEERGLTTRTGIAPVLKAVFRVYRSRLSDPALQGDLTEAIDHGIVSLKVAHAPQAGNAVAALIGLRLDLGTGPYRYERTQES